MKRNGDIKLAALPPAAAAILELTKVRNLFELFENAADAVDSFYRFPADVLQQNLIPEYSIGIRSAA